MTLRRLCFSYGLTTVIALASCSAPANCSFAAHAKLEAPILHFCGKLLGRDGKSAANSVVTVELINKVTAQVVGVCKIAPISDGSYSGDIPFEPLTEEPVAFAAAPGLIALVQLPGAPDRVTTLVPAEGAAIKIADSDGKILEGVKPDSLGKLIWDNMTQPQMFGPATGAEIADSSSGLVSTNGLPDTYLISLEAKDGSQPQQVTAFVDDESSGSRVIVNSGDKTSSASGTVYYGNTGRPAVGFVIQMSGNNVADVRYSDSNGHYRFDKLSPGSYTFRIDGTSKTTPPGPATRPKWTAYGRQETLDGAENVDHLDFSLIHGGIVTGVITDSKTGKPDAGLIVMSMGGACGGDGMDITDANGKYTICITPGLHYVSATPPNFDGFITPHIIQVLDSQVEELDFSVSYTQITQEPAPVVKP